MSGGGGGGGGGSKAKSRGWSPQPGRILAPPGGLGRVYSKFGGEGRGELGQGEGPLIESLLQLRNAAV